MKVETERFLDGCWARCLGCSQEQLRDGGRHVAAAPDSTGRVKRPWPLKPKSVCLVTCDGGWVLSVPSRQVAKARALCTGRSFSQLTAQGDLVAEQWYSRGARDSERDRFRNGYAPLESLTGDAAVRGWSHYFNWYCDRAGWAEGAPDEHVIHIDPDNAPLWRQWLKWPGPFCRASFADCFEVCEAFGYLVDGRLVSVAQIQTARADFAWEFGVDTSPEFRRRGFGTAAARAATAFVLERGRIAWYYYDHYNRASAAIPRRLGYSLHSQAVLAHISEANGPNGRP